MWLYIFICVIVFIIFYSFKKDPEPLLGIYSQPGKWYWLKYICFYTFLYFRRLGLAWHAGYGRKARSTLQEAESVQKLSNHPLAIDAAYFNGYNKQGFYFGAGVQRRPQGRVESLFYFRVPNVGLLEWPFAPSTATREGQTGTYSTEGGLKFECLTPFKQWRVTLDGQLKIRETGKMVKTKFDFLWTSSTDWFDFDTDMHPHTVSQAIATEPWTRSFFDRLRDAHQTHHEQFGVLKGTLQIQDHREMQIEMSSMRDHSYGLYRNWGDFHRYALSYLSFDDGTHLGLHLISLKPTMTHLVTGFVMDPKQLQNRKIPVYSCDRPLYSLGEDGQPPENYKISFIAGNKIYKVECEMLEIQPYYCGWNQEAQLNAYFCKAKMNGIEGRGMCEFEYNTAGKWNLARN